ncbi:UNVERIFIED_CONTAM: VAN3-binding protein [Sesamum calycinum]|uniref:VAN3-binding protein n=2 Tax=Sesamum TaxID=4181 RepID=A0AAW2LZE1_9LAMI
MESVPYWLKHAEEDNEVKGEMALPAIPQPETPTEPMEFLSRSWSLSATEISKALARKQMQPAFDNSLSSIPETDTAPYFPSKVMKPVNGRTRAGAIGRLFHPKECNVTSTIKKKDKARMENAHMHAILSIAGLAAALAAAASAEKSKDSSSKMSMAMASATELLASYCIDLAESAGTDRERVASVVTSAVGIRTASDLLTLTAAAATALRGEAALRARLPKEAKRSAAISPYEKVMVDCRSPEAFYSEIEEEDLPCVGDLLQLSRKGVLRWKHVSVYINKACQVTIKLKSRHVGGAFSKNNKSIVYEVIDESGGWPFMKERENMEVYFGVKTAQGLLEFKCKNKVHKQKWVHGIRKLLHRRSQFQEADDSLRTLTINKSI